MNKQNRFEVKISLVNVAFDADPRPEIRRILADLVERLHDNSDIYFLQDYNGNTVGSAAFGKAVYL